MVNLLLQPKNTSKRAIVKNDSSVAKKLQIRAHWQLRGIIMRLPANQLLPHWCKVTKVAQEILTERDAYSRSCREIQYCRNCKNDILITKLANTRTTIALKDYLAPSKSQQLQTSWTHAPQCNNQHHDTGVSYTCVIDSCITRLHRSRGLSAESAKDEVKLTRHRCEHHIWHLSQQSRLLGVQKPSTKGKILLVSWYTWM